LNANRTRQLGHMSCRKRRWALTLRDPRFVRPGSQTRCVHASCSKCSHETGSEREGTGCGHKRAGSRDEGVKGRDTTTRPCPGLRVNGRQEKCGDTHTGPRPVTLIEGNQKTTTSGKLWPQVRAGEVCADYLSPTRHRPASDRTVSRCPAHFLGFVPRICQPRWRLGISRPLTPN
jgi:hypothetical protein